MGHDFHDVLNILVKGNKYVMSMNISNLVKCSTYTESKLTRAPKIGHFVKHFSNITTIYEYICDPVQAENLEEKRHLLKMKTTSRRYLNVQLLKYWHETVQHVHNFIATVDRNCRLTVKRVHIGNAKEFLL